MLIVGLRTCRGCDCDDNHACETIHGPCAWVLLDIATPTGICSACAEDCGWDPEWMITVGQEPQRAAGGRR